MREKNVSVPMVFVSPCLALDLLLKVGSDVNQMFVCVLVQGMIR